MTKLFPKNDDFVAEFCVTLARSVYAKIVTIFCARDMKSIPFAQRLWRAHHARVFHHMAQCVSPSKTDHDKFNPGACKLYFPVINFCVGFSNL